MYARFIDEFTVIAAPAEYWGERGFRNDPAALAANGFLPVRHTPREPHKRPRYEVANGEITVGYVEYAGTALAAYRRKLIDRLQAVFKAHEQAYLNSSDVTMASVLAISGKPKGAAVTAWVTGLWAAYFVEKEKIEAATGSAGFAAVDFNAARLGEPPHSMKELSLEAAELYAEAANKY